MLNGDLPKEEMVIVVNHAERRVCSTLFANNIAPATHARSYHRAEAASIAVPVALSVVKPFPVPVPVPVPIPVSIPFPPSRPVAVPIAILLALALPAPALPFSQLALPFPVPLPLSRRHVIHICSINRDHVCCHAAATRDAVDIAVAACAPMILARALQMSAGLAIAVVIPVAITVPVPVTFAVALPVPITLTLSRARKVAVAAASTSGVRISGRVVAVTEVLPGRARVAFPVALALPLAATAAALELGIAVRASGPLAAAFILVVRPGTAELAAARSTTVTAVSPVAVGAGVAPVAVTASTGQPGGQDPRGQDAAYLLRDVREGHAAAPVMDVRPPAATVVMRRVRLVRREPLALSLPLPLPLPVAPRLATRRPRPARRREAASIRRAGGVVAVVVAAAATVGAVVVRANGAWAHRLVVRVHVAAGRAVPARAAVMVMMVLARAGYRMGLEMCRRGAVTV